MKEKIHIHRFANYKATEDLRRNIFINGKKKFTELNIENNISLLNYLEINCNNKEFISFYNVVKPEYKQDYIICLLGYYLGGIIINDKIIINNISYLSNIELAVVKSCINNNLFTGFLYVKKNNNIILNTITEFIKSNQEICINQILHNNILTEQINNKNADKNIVILEELIIDNVSHIHIKNKSDTVIAKHYFASESLEIIFADKNKNNDKDLTKLKIGITFDVPKNLNDFYCNGIRQNAIYFFELLNNMGYNVNLIIENSKEENINTIQKEIDFYYYKYSLLENIFVDNYDLVFSFGFSVSGSLLYILKMLNVKVVNYQCGNSYLISTERILYNQHDGMVCDGYPTSFDKNKIPDQIWSIPQMYKQNKGFWEVLHRTNCIQVPFIWSSNSINFVKNILKVEEEKLLFCKKEGKVGIFEPNISVMKWCLPCVLICEKAYRKYKNIPHVYVTNMSIEKKPDEFKINKFNNTEFNNICKHLEITMDKKLSVENRYITLDFMLKFADIAVSHQWENPLNYLYLDLAWMGWPILHNAYLCKDVGYYYEEFDYDTAVEELNNIIKNHESVKDDYLEKNRKVIDRYLPTNIELQNAYRKLIENLFI